MLGKCPVTWNWESHLCASILWHFVLSLIFSPSFCVIHFQLSLGGLARKNDFWCVSEEWLEWHHGYFKSLPTSTRFFEMVAWKLELNLFKICFDWVTERKLLLRKLSCIYSKKVEHKGIENPVEQWSCRDGGAGDSPMC